MALEMEGTALHQRRQRKAKERHHEGGQWPAHSPNDFWRKQHEPGPQLLDFGVQAVQQAAV